MEMQTLRGDFPNHGRVALSRRARLEHLILTSVSGLTKDHWDAIEARDFAALLAPMSQFLLLSAAQTGNSLTQEMLDEQSATLTAPTAEPMWRAMDAFIALCRQACV